VREPDPAPWVWTGTSSDGTAQGLGLGGQSDNWAGRYTSVFPAWILKIHMWEGVQAPLYALSNPLKAEAVPSVPEPSALTLVGILLGGLALRGRVARGGGR
jgi:hypothetical protein